MATTINVGWLNDYNGDKFAPKTLSSQVMNSDGSLFEESIKTYVDETIDGVNTSINNIINGTTKVKEAIHAENADTSNHADSSDMATNAEMANSSTKATQDASGNIITSTYETKTDAQSKLEEAMEYTDSAVSGKANTVHSHHDLYYTESEVDDKLDETKDYIDTKVSELATGNVVNEKIEEHNVSAESHEDIRELITNLNTKLTKFLDIDDTTTDQLSEVLTLIENNKGTLESLTTSKINVSDIIDNLTTNVSNKPLSAAQGVILKGLIDSLQAEVDDNLTAQNNHINNKNNPHGVTLNQLGINVSADELNHMAGITSNVQSQLNNKSNVDHGHIISDITNLQNELDGKQPNITGGATTITTNNLTTNRALISNSSGKVAVSNVTNTELGYLSGTTSSIQTQLDSRLKYTSNGTVGQFAISDGQGGVTWISAEKLYGLHVWNKYDSNPTHTETTVTDQVICSYMGTTTVTYANSIEIVDGIVSLHNPKSISSLSISTTNMLGKYIKYNNVIYGIPSNAEVTKSTSNVGNYQTIKYTASTAIKYTSATATKLGFVMAESEDAYPANGEQDGVWYVYNNTFGGQPSSEIVSFSGTAGQFAVSDGNGGITWLTVKNGNEVAY